MIKRILVLNPFGIGDVLFSTPLVRSIKEQMPNVSIHYICNRRVEPILRTNPFIDQIYVFEKDEWKALIKRSKLQAFQKALRAWRRIAEQRFDALFDLSFNDSYSFFLCYAWQF